MREGPLFSVIVPAHNCAGFMRRGMDSISEQDFRDYELIIVCDSCTDNTAEIAAEYGDAIILTDHGRAGMARNAGLDAATGEWILFMDDDDWFLTGAFEAIAQELEKQKEIDVLAFCFEWKGQGIAIQRQGRVYPAVWNKAWRREFIGSERFPDWIHTDDLGFAWKMHPRARFGFLSVPLYHYEFMRPGSVSDRIRKGEYDNSVLPEEARPAAEGYERWLKSKEFDT